MKQTADSDVIATPGSRPAACEPDWVRHAIAWHVFPLGAVGAPALCPQGNPQDRSSPAGQVASEHRLRRLIGWLDHLVLLGANVLQLGPVFHSMSHGYDTVDYFRLDPRLGSNEDLTDLIQAAHERGIRVLLDGVFNHTGIAYPAFAHLAQTGPDCPEAAMYHLSWPQDRPGGTPWTPGQPPSGYRRFEGQDWLPELNHECPVVADLVTRVMTYWCERGVDGWRLDAAYAVDPRFWRQVLPRVRQRFPDLYVYGEVIHGDYGRLVRESRDESAPPGAPSPRKAAAGMNAVTQYELWQAVWHSLADANFYELDWCLRRHAALLEGTVPPGSEPAEPAASPTAAGTGGFVPWTFLSNHDTTRIASQLANCSQPGSRLPHAVALLALLPGTPCVYYGDEEGWAGVKESRLGGDDAVRPPLPLAAPDAALANEVDPLLPAPAPHTQSPVQPAHPLPGLDPDRVRALYQELLGLRRRQPWLHDAHQTILHLDNRLLSLLLTPRHTEDSSQPRRNVEPRDDTRDGVVLVLSLEDHEAWLPTDGAHTPLAYGVGDGLAAQGGAKRVAPRAVRDGVVLPAGGWAVLSHA